jgi:hypothetical protein
MRFRTLVGAAGACSLAVGALFMYAPEYAARVAPLETARTALGGIDPSMLLVGVGGAFSLYAVLAAWAASVTSTADSSTATRYGAAEREPPETVTDDSRAGVTALVGSSVGAVTRESEADAARAELRATVRAALDAAGRDGEQALADGSWTDSRLAAATLSESEAVVPSVWSRLRRWVDAERERERRFRVALREVEACVDEHAEGEP